MISFARLQKVAVIGVLMAASVACSAAQNLATPTLSPTGVPALVTPVTSMVGPTATLFASASPTAAVTVLPTASASLPSVDLVFTGSTPLVVKGSAGRCMEIGPGSFEFSATGADYPGLGEVFSVVEFAPDDIAITWVVDAAKGYDFGRGSRLDIMSITVSADHLSIALHGDLDPGHGKGYPQPGPEQLNGTINCPPLPPNAMPTP